MQYTHEEGVPLLNLLVQRNKTVQLQFLALNGAKADVTDTKGKLFPLLSYF